MSEASMTKEQLIQALESAIEGSRELDARVALEMGALRYRNWYDDEARTVHAWHVSWVMDVWEPLPRYTESLDAARTLVPKGWVWQVKHVIQAQAVVWSLEIDWDDREPPTGYSEQPALALCIAALRARPA